MSITNSSTTDAQRHRAYYEHRERQERALALHAGSPEGRLVHLQLADRYAALAQDHAAGPRTRLTIQV
ncbi:hypothetical protein [Sphingomonas sp. GV3]|jgi:hypothetical protein|uniref:hypothetical protein n=1 Tax=Sphingomonas sp. GV3 TaxID=3040671 RepID=UPI00280C2D28|nr:hypothetical protein [Sphingomonas sp. GV3]